MKRLKELRKQRNLTQKDLAKILGVYPQSVGYYENNINKPDPDMLIKIADYFQVSVDYLLGREDDLGNISISGSPALELTADERELVDTFRAIPDNTKGVALTMLHSLAPAKKEKSTLNKRA